MKAIRTRYSGPTNTRGSRIHATDSDGNRVSVSLDYSGRDDHEFAAYSLMRKMGWGCQLVGGGFGHDQYWVMIPTVGSNAVPAWKTYFESLEKSA